MVQVLRPSPGVTCPQALHHTPVFRQEMVQAAAPHTPLLSTLCDLLIHLDTATCLAISPRDFLTASRPAWFEEGEQQDCSEYLTAMLASLQEEQEEEKAMAADSPVRKVFGGRMETSHTCHQGPLFCSSILYSAEHHNSQYPIPLRIGPLSAPCFAPKIAEAGRQGR